MSLTSLRTWNDLKTNLYARFPHINTAELVSAMRGYLVYEKNYSLDARYHDLYAPAFSQPPWSFFFLWPPLTRPLFRYLCGGNMWQYSSVLLLRSAQMEFYLEKAISRGVDQYVLVAAGMDSFVLRRPDLASKVHVFELDLGSTQKRKKSCMKRIGVDLPDTHHFIPCDLTSVSLAEALKTSPGFDFSKPAFFSMMGISYYLPEETFYGIAQHIHQDFAGGSAMAFDYLLDDASLDKEQKTCKSDVLGLVEGYGEPMIFESSMEKLSGRFNGMNFVELGSHAIDELYKEYHIAGHATASPSCYAVAAWST